MRQKLDLVSFYLVSFLVGHEIRFDTDFTNRSNGAVLNNENTLFLNVHQPKISNKDQC